MFQDYCVAHGRPCIPDSLYCCEDCKNQDIIECSRPVYSSIESSKLGKSPSGGHFLYECCLCNTSHQPYVPCNEANSEYKLFGGPGFEYDGDEYRHDKEYHSDGNSEYDERPRMGFSPNGVLEALKSYDFSNDISIRNNNQLIQSNYRKWLFQITPR